MRDAAIVCVASSPADGRGYAGLLSRRKGDAPDAAGEVVIETLELSHE